MKIILYITSLFLIELLITKHLSAQVEPNFISTSGSFSGGNDEGRKIVFDTNGNKYVCGHFNGTAFFESTILDAQGGADIFIAKYNSNGVLQWAKRAGGYSDDFAYGISANDTEVYITGSFNGASNFNTPFATGSNEIFSAGGYDIFIAKFNSNGDFLWAKRGGGVGEDVSNSIIIELNDIYITGSFRNTANFNNPSMIGTNQITSSGNTDIFIAKFNSSGDFLWAKRAGGSGADESSGIGVNGNEVYITGSFRNTANFNTPSVFGFNEIISEGGTDIFIAQYNNNGDFQWAKRAGGTNQDISKDVSVNGNKIYITGSFSTISNFNTPSAIGSNEIISEGGLDIFLAEYNNFGDFQWAKRAGGTGDDESRGVAVFGNDIYITGSFNNNINFNTPSLPGNNEITSIGNKDIFLSQFNNNGDFQWAKRAGGLSDDIAFGIAVNLNEINITGSFKITANFNTPSVFGTNDLTSYGDFDILIAQYNSFGDFQSVHHAGGGGIGIDQGRHVTVDTIGNMYVCGLFCGTSYFDSIVLVSEGLTDIFIAKYNVNGGLEWVKSAGGVNHDEAYGIVVNQNGVYITGFFSDTINFDTPTIFGSNQIISEGNNDIFLAKYDSNGNFQWVKRAGGIGSDVSNSIILNGSDIFITGSFQNTANFNTPSSFGSNEITSVVGSHDIFLAKFNDNGDFIWVKRGGSFGDDFSRCVDVIGNEVYITGSFTNTANFNTPSFQGINEITSIGSFDNFVSKFNNNGDFQWVRRFGGTGDDFSNALDIIDNDVYVTGYFEDTANFNTPSVSGVNEITSIGEGDYYIAQFNSNGDFQWHRRIGGYVYCLELNYPEILITGAFSGVNNFNNPYSNGSNQISSFGGSLDIFVARFSCTTPAPPFGSPTLAFCDQSSIGELNASGTNISWYNSSIGGIALQDNLPLINGTTYYATQTANGCESILRLPVQIAINESFKDTITQISCNSYYWDENGQTYVLSGVFSQLYTNSVGCDSIITLNLVINNVSDTTIFLVNETISSNNSNASYQWLDCNDNSPISGAINQSFNAISNGIYALQITENGCTATSECVEVMSTGIINNNELKTIQIYPNPFNYDFFIISENIGLPYFIFDSQGRLIFSDITSNSSTNVNLNIESKGIYFLKINNELFKLIKF